MNVIRDNYYKNELRSDRLPINGFHSYFSDNLLIRTYFKLFFLLTLIPKLSKTVAFCHPSSSFRISVIDFYSPPRGTSAFAWFNYTWCDRSALEFSPSFFALYFVPFAIMHFLPISPDIHLSITFSNFICCLLTPGSAFLIWQWRFLA